MVPSKSFMMMAIAIGQCIGQKRPVTFLDGLYPWTK
jgi:hypothetical protein